MARTVTRGGGRPPRAVPRQIHIWNPPLELPLYEAILDQSQRAGVSVSSYAQILLSDAFATFSPFLPEVQRPLPTAVPVDEFLRRVEALTADDCVKPVAPTHRIGIRADKMLAERVTARAIELDVNDSTYIRAVMHVAAGTNAHELRESRARDEGRVPHLAEVP